ncbi:hypothetical protein P389DRAFT_193204 [Cystobasidium minutum MCA 4210]|uniref:uncharacterized protein n=1 Tax=Cystobasidium minutum MCA 4210 TaxID=1397322 RepID=UPI0034CD2296|eukprot:jgi/Rhomi1/193204/gm1.1418_g
MPENESRGLKDHLLSALKSQARGKRAFELCILRSQPKRSHALFPWASESSVKIYVEYEMLILSEKAVSSSESEETKNNGQNGETARFVPVYGLETAIYTIPSTSTCLIYVSKADTTGLLPTPAPSRVLTNAYLRYYLQNPPHQSSSLRIHVFARAQDQYLFPGSIENKAKRVLPDNVLCKWWREVLGDSAAQVTVEAKKQSIGQDISMYYLLGGFDFGESLAVLSRAPEPSEPSAPQWQYGHPYAKAKPPLPVPNPEQITINDLIPAFQDDPKARQMTEWASSPIPYAGQDGDYDEIAEEIRKLESTSPALYELRSREIQEQKDTERIKLTKDKERDIDGFWEVMGNRGECASGHVAGFFVVVSEQGTAAPAPTEENNAEKQSETQSISTHLTKAVKSATASLPHATYVKLWSQIHNVNYASVDKAAEGYAKWKADLEHACKRTGSTDADFSAAVYGSVDVDNAVTVPAESLKRAEPPKQVNTLQVKKKKKVA